MICKTTTCRCTGDFRLVFQKPSSSAVNISGAVSPLMRATASSTPVINAGSWAAR